MTNNTKRMIFSLSYLLAMIDEHKKTTTFSFYSRKLKNRLTRIRNRINDTIQANKKELSKIDVYKETEDTKKYIEMKQKVAASKIKKEHGDSMIILDDFKDDLPKEFLDFVTLTPIYENIIEDNIKKNKSLNEKTRKCIVNIAHNLDFYSKFVESEVLT